jgi:hypothetical protein
MRLPSPWCAPSPRESAITVCVNSPREWPYAISVYSIRLFNIIRSLPR